MRGVEHTVSSFIHSWSFTSVGVCVSDCYLPECSSVLFPTTFHLFPHINTRLAPNMRLVYCQVYGGGQTVFCTCPATTKLRRLIWIHFKRLSLPDWFEPEDVEGRKGMKNNLFSISSFSQPALKAAIDFYLPIKVSPPEHSIGNKCTLLLKLFQQNNYFRVAVVCPLNRKIFPPLLRLMTEFIKRGRSAAPCSSSKGDEHFVADRTIRRGN